MKRKHVKIVVIFVVACVIAVFSCDDMNSLHQQYLDRGVGIYIGAPDSLIAYSGHYKVLLKWKINADSRISNAVIYWDERAESKTIPVVRTTPGPMWMEAVIEELQEGIPYLFEVQMQDKAGNISYSIEVAASVFGDSYLETLSTREIKEIGHNGSNFAVIWEDVVSTTLHHTEIEYVDNNGLPVTLQILNDDIVTALPGLNPNQGINVFSVHTFGDGFESLNSTKKSYSIPSPLNISPFVLKNYLQPIVIRPESPAMSARFYQAADWIHGGDMSKGFTVDNLAPGGQALCLYTNGGADYNFTNGKLFQTVTLPAGIYRVDANVIRSMNNGNNLKAYIVAAKGTDLPDIDNVESQALEYLEINQEWNNNPARLLSIEFELNADGDVSLGFVGRANANYLTIIGRVELWLSF